MKYGSAAAISEELFLFRLQVGGGPEQRLGDGHVQEVFPGLGLQLLHLLLVGLGVVLELIGDVLDGFVRAHVESGLCLPWTSSMPR